MKKLILASWATLLLFLFSGVATAQTSIDLRISSITDSPNDNFLFAGGPPPS